MASANSHGVATSMFVLHSSILSASSCRVSHRSRLARQQPCGSRQCRSPPVRSHPTCEPMRQRRDSEPCPRHSTAQPGAELLSPPSRTGCLCFSVTPGVTDPYSTPIKCGVASDATLMHLFCGTLNHTSDAVGTSSASSGFLRQQQPQPTPYVASVSNKGTLTSSAVLSIRIPLNAGCLSPPPV